MPQTPIGTATPYCSATQLFRFHDWQQVADLLRDGDNPRPTKSRLLDSASDEGAMLVSILLSASGQLESACLVSNRYLPTDLAALTNSGAARLQKIVADLAFWELMQRRQPGSADPKNVPGAMQALEELDRLRDGERIFGLAESGNAGLPKITEPDSSVQWNPVTTDASRLFGNHSSNSRRRN